MELGGLPEFVTGLRLDLLMRLLLAAVLGGMIGLEREFSGKPAGFRTNLLICVGAALLTELSISVAVRADPMITMADPGRIAAQIVSGIGFLGAGTIIQARGSVLGLTTAATLWVVAAIGMAVGAAAYLEAVGATVLVIVALVFLGRFDRWLVGRRVEQHLRVTMEPAADVLQGVYDRIEAAGFEVEPLEIEREQSRVVASFMITGPGGAMERLMTDLLEAAGVAKVSYAGKAGLPI